jgi:hypothetical protein
MTTNYTVELTGTERDEYIAQRFNKPEKSVGIYKTIDIYDFRRAFADYNRADQFSYEGLGALFDWLDELSTDTDTPYELDASIALCCEFTEYSNLAEIKDIYSNTEINNIDDLRVYTTVIEFDGGIIIQDF